MKRTLTVVGIAALVLVAMFATAGLAFAQGPATTPQGPGTCGIGGGSWRWGGNGINPFAAVAELLGMSTEDLSAKLSEGATVLELAGGKDVVGAITAPRFERIDAAVQAGTITAEQAELMKNTMTEHVRANLEAGTLGLGNGQGRGAAGGGRMSRMGGQGCQGFVDSDGDGICDNDGTQTRGGRGGRWGNSAQSL